MGISPALIIVTVIAAAIICVVLIVIFSRHVDYPKVFPPRPTRPEKRAGNRAETFMTDELRSILRRDDILLSNVDVEYDGKITELDNVIINKNGVFILEVKYYTGRLEGTEDSFEWTKYHVSGGGNVYSKTVKNPIKQVRRQVYILAKHLDYYGLRVWVEGFAIILGAQSPVRSRCIVSNLEEFDRIIHSPGKNRLTDDAVKKITDLLSD